MNDIIPMSISRFSEGMTQERVETGTGAFSVTKGFDILTEPARLVPTRSTTTDTASTGIGNLLVGSDGIIYGLGLASGSSVATQVYKKPDNASAWSAIPVASTGSSAANYDLFVEYADIGNARSILAAGNGGIAMMDKANSLSINTHTLTFTSISQGIVHPKDDILYIPYTTSTGTFIASCNAGTWNDTALTLPTGLIATSLTWQGNYLAIGCAPRGAFTLSSTGKTLANSANGGAYKSVIFLWDRDTSLATLSESIDWGTGILQVLNNLDGRLIGISNVGGATSNIADHNSIVIKEYQSNVPTLVKEITTTKQTTTSPSVNINPYVNFIFRNRLYFSIDIVGGNTSPKLYGLWSMGTSKNSGRYSVAIERSATTDDTETSVLAAAATGDYFAMVYSAKGTLGFSVNNSAFATIFQATSYLETLIFNSILGLRGRHIPDSSVKKKLLGVTVIFEPLTSAGQVNLKYRKDEETTWTTIFTFTGTNALSHSAINIESTGANLPEYKEIQFRIESIGGAVITGFKAKAEIQDKDIY